MHITKLLYTCFSVLSARAAQTCRVYLCGTKKDLLLQSSAPPAPELKPRAIALHVLTEFAARTPPHTAPALRSFAPTLTHSSDPDPSFAFCQMKWGHALRSARARTVLIARLESPRTHDVTYQLSQIDHLILRCA